MNASVSSNLIVMQCVYLALLVAATPGLGPGQLLGLDLLVVEGPSLSVDEGQELTCSTK